MGIRADLQMIERAVKRRWNFDRSLAEKAIEEGLKSRDPRVQVRALGIAVAMEKQNQADEHKVLDIGNQHNRDRIADVIARLGINPALVFDGRPDADVDASGDGESDIGG